MPIFPEYNSATVQDLGTNNSNIAYTADDGANAFLFRSAASGGDTITGFGTDDSLIADQDIFDGNGDGYIDFGSNNLLDVERTGSGNSKAGDYRVAVSGIGNDSIQTIRYLGNKEGSFVYAAADTRDQLLGHFKKGFNSTSGVTGGDESVAGTTRYELTVADDTLALGAGKNAILFDNGLGLNMGNDKITGFGDDDLLIFTAKLFDSDGDNVVRFAKNSILDVSSLEPSSEDPRSSTDSVGAPGGSIDLNSPNITKLAYLGEKTIGSGLSEVTYYYYGTVDYVGTPAGVTPPGSF